MHYHTLSIEDSITSLNSSKEQGLTQREVKKRQAQYGYNELQVKKGKSLLARFLSQFSDFMIIILIIAAIISFSVSLLEGKPDYVDPLIIFAIIILNAILGVIQEAKAEKTLEALKKMSAPNAMVIREGVQLSISSKELVPGDIILLETGHYIPADARLIQAVNLKVDESALTGESHPVEKQADVILKESTLLGDRKNMVPATGIITYGRGMAIVTSIGMNTEVGNIAKMIINDDEKETPLQKRLAQTGKMLGIAAIAICISIFLLGTIQGRPIFEMFMTSVSLAVAAIPEGLPAVVTIMLSLGVQRMAKKKAIIRKLPAVETLGCATFICSDKTGTLTQNVMTVTKIASIEGFCKENTSTSNFILEHAALCNDAQIHGKSEAFGEPTEKALVLAARRCGLDKEKLDFQNKRVYEIPFDSARKLMTTVHIDRKGSYRSITKGAFDVLIKRCSHIYQNGTVVQITEAHRLKLDRLNLSMTEEALRVIAIAYKELQKAPASYIGKDLEDKLILIGLLGLIDPPREEVKDAVSVCKTAGITPVMITGDHVSTACAIAKELGILTQQEYEQYKKRHSHPNGLRHKKDSPPLAAITGEELEQLTVDEFEANVHRYRVFARVSPEHKVRIVKALQKKGEIVAMTGDGVNDAPALKAADIGCAMGLSGTDVAKNAADMILMDDNFATIVSAVKEGRGIYDNIKKSVHFLLSSNIGEIITIFVAILFGLPSPLLPVQLLWVNLVTDSLPAIALGVEQAEKDTMNKPPISPKKGIFSDGLIFKILFEGAMIGLLALIAYMIGDRSMAFAVLSISQLFHAFNMRSSHSLRTVGVFTNPKMVLAFLVCTFMQIIVISVPALAIVFKVVPMNLTQWCITFALAFVPIVIVELQKAVTHKG